MIKKKIHQGTGLRIKGSRHSIKDRSADSFNTNRALSQSGGKTSVKHDFSSESDKKKSLADNIWRAILLVFFIFIVGAILFVRFVDGNVITFISGYLFGRDLELKTAKADHINLLLLGIGGEAHEGPNLSDTIVFAHIDVKKNQIELFSIPRDLWISHLASKINGAYAFGEKEGGKGIFFAKSVVESVVGQTIDYSVVVDFEGFVDFVDMLGGIEVDVQKSFIDKSYPLVGREDDLCGHSEEEVSLIVATASSSIESFFPCRYEEVAFERGKQMMNGERALLFVRSRHAEGDEGTDFARSKRQNQVISAVKSKILSLGTLANPTKLFGMVDVLKEHIITNIKPSEYDDFVKLAQKMQEASVSHIVIDTGDEEKGVYGLLVNPAISSEYSFQWVLIPRKGNGDFSEIKEYTECVIEDEQCSITAEGVYSLTNKNN